MVNMAKSAIVPIQCNEVDLETLYRGVPLHHYFPIKYSRLPLSHSKLRKADTLLLVEKFANQLPRWKSGLIPLSGRIILLNAVITAMCIYHMLVLDLPPWLLWAADKIRRGFLWAGSDCAKGGQCLVAWENVCTPIKYGCLGLHNLQALNHALRTK